METNNELELAWEFIEHTSTSIFLTGKAGTGKTTFLRTLSIFIKNVDVITISNDMNILEEISSLSKSKYSLRILIIEGR